MAYMMASKERKRKTGAEREAVKKYFTFHPAKFC